VRLKCFCLKDCAGHVDPNNEKPARICSVLCTVPSQTKETEQSEIHLRSQGHPRAAVGDRTMHNDIVRPCQEYAKMKSIVFSTFSKRAAIVQSTTETAVDYLLRSTSCYTVCRLLSAPLRDRKRRLRKSRISSATRKKGRTAPKRIPESLAAQNFHWRCMANTIAKPSLGEHLRDRVTKSIA